MVVDNLPLHVLLVHFVVVLVPLAALCVVASVVWPAARRRLGIVTPALALATMLLVPVVTDAGAWLRARVPSTPLINAHAALGLTLYPWTVALFVVSAVQWAWFFFVDRETPPRWSRLTPRWARFTVARPSRIVRRVVLAVLVVAAAWLAVGTIVDVVMIGEAGSRALWLNNFSPTPLPTHRP